MIPDQRLSLLFGKIRVHLMKTQRIIFLYKKLQHQFLGIFNLFQSFLVGGASRFGFGAVPHENCTIMIKIISEINRRS